VIRAHPQNPKELPEPKDELPMVRYLHYESPGAFQVDVLWKEPGEGEGAHSILEAERPTCL